MLVTKEAFLTLFPPRPLFCFCLLLWADCGRLRSCSADGARRLRRLGGNDRRGQRAAAKEARRCRSGDKVLSQVGKHPPLMTPHPHVTLVLWSHDVEDACLCALFYEVWPPRDGVK